MPPTFSGRLFRRVLQNHARSLADLATGLLLALAGGWLMSNSSATGRALVRTSYDASLLAVAPFRPSLAGSPVVIVYLDAQSYEREGQNPSLPWDRKLHARLLDRLSHAGAKLVVFDILFDRPGRDQEADTALAAAIRRNGRVVLSGELTRTGSSPEAADGAVQNVVTPPLKLFRDAAAGWGLANCIIDPDIIVRRHFTGFDADGEPSLSTAAARNLGIKSSGERGDRWLNYYGGPLSVPYRSYSDVLSGDVPDAELKDRIVFVGARPTTGGFPDRRDEFRSPLMPFSREVLMPAVEAHAVQMLNLVRGDWLERPPAWKERTGLLVSAFGLAWLLFLFRPLQAALVALVLEMALIAGVVALLLHQHVWFPWLLVAVVQIPGALAGSSLFRTVEWLRQKRVYELRRREDESKIREQAELIDKAQDAILVHDLDGRVTYANPGDERLYGFSLDKLRRLDPEAARFGTNSSLVRTARETALAKGEWLGELHQSGTGSRPIIVQSRWTLIRDSAGNPKALLCVNTDITEKKRLEAEFFRAQRMESIGALASGMAHDLNNALSPILMGVQLIRGRVADEELLRMLEVMETNTHRGAEMVRQVLMFSKGHGGAMEPVDLGPLIREMEAIARQTFPKSIRVSSFVATDLWRTTGNPTQLHQVLLNLCVNARDAMPEGGELSLAADNVALSAEEAAAWPGAQAGDHVLLLVTDSGTGIPPELLPKIFEPFFSTKAPDKGTGLGLSTTMRIVKAHGGFVRVKSQPGEGTTFEIHLPKAPPADTRGTNAKSAVSPRGAGELVLFVDDDQSVRDMACASLKEHGYRVLAAASGLEALAAVEAHRDAVDLVLLDHEMPGMDGAAVLRSIRSSGFRMAVVLMSGGSPASMGPSTAPEAFLAKPFPLDELLRVVHAALRGRR